MLAKSKLSSLEALILQALIDFGISHEEFKRILNEKEMYEQMKESIRNTKSRDELSEIVGILEKMLEIHKLQRKMFFFCYV